MSQTKISKLTLQRETLIPLTPDELEDINGGTSAFTRTIIQASKAYCGPVAKWVTQNVCVPASQAVCTTILPHGNGGGQGQ